MEEEVVVLDPGSAFFKAGFAGEPFPRVSLPSVVGRPRYPGVLFDSGRKDYYVGEEAELKRGSLGIRHPIRNGAIVDFEDTEKLVQQVFFGELRVSPDEVKGIVVSECPLIPKSSRIKFSEILFEKYRANSLFYTLPGILSLYAAGYTTGLVLTVGDGVSHTTPVFEGNILPSGILRSNVAGGSITDTLVKMINARGTRTFASTGDYEIARDMKEKHSYVALSYEEEVRRALSNPPELEASYMLPDENPLSIARERFTCAEVLFKPGFFLGSEEGGVQELIANSISKFDKTITRVFYERIVVAGGTTMLKNFPERLQDEVKALAPVNCDVKVVAPRERKFSAWLGGSLLGSTSLKKYNRMWIEKKDWEEFGENIVHRKCY